MNDRPKQYLQAAHESLGIYPQATKRGDTWEYRTPYQDGWNAALLALLTRYRGIKAWIAALPTESVDALNELLAADVLFLRVEDNAVTCYLNMNDTFAYACADAEEVTVANLPAVAQIWRGYGADGLIVWAAIQRDEEPIAEIQTDTYCATRTALKKEETP